MSNGDLTFWNSGVWLIPVILLATLGGLYLLVRYWRNRTQQDLKHNRSELRGFQNQLRQIYVTIQNYQKEEGEPYASRLVAINVVPFPYFMEQGNKLLIGKKNGMQI